MDPRWRKARMLSGGCVDCVKDAALGHIRCEYHLQKQREYDKEARSRKKLDCVHIGEVFKDGNLKDVVCTQGPPMHYNDYSCYKCKNFRRK